MRAEERHVVGQLGGDPAQTALAGDLERVPRLDLQMRDAGPHGLPLARPSQRQQLLVGGGARALDDTRIPPAAYGAPAIRAANSSARSPANTRWVWLSTNPGITQRAGGVDALVRSGAGRFNRRHELVLAHERGVAHDAERPLAERLLARHKQPDVVNDERAHDATARTARSSSAAASTVR